MDRRDQELLDKQLWSVNPAAPRSGGTLGLTFVAAFLGGLFIGGFLFAHKSNQTQTMSHDAIIAFSLLNSSPTTR